MPSNLVRFNITKHNITTKYILINHMSVITERQEDYNLY